MITSSTNDAGNLYSFYQINGNASDVISGPLYFVRSGRIISGGLDESGNKGYYRSKTIKDYYSSYNFHISSPSIDPTENGSARYLGMSVRCIAR